LTAPASKIKFDHERKQQGNPKDYSWRQIIVESGSQSEKNTTTLNAAISQTAINTHLVYTTLHLILHGHCAGTHWQTSAYRSNYGVYAS
jgi:hypothetical protein